MFENQGYATEMVKYLVTKAFSHENITGVTARTLREKNASTRILEKNGFVFKGEITDEEDGLVWEWEKKKSSG
jgi:RimJ/RimL family protein N-acetyltransferase